MITTENLQGAIFDLDDTLLDNGPANDPTMWLHARSRLAAIHEIAEAHHLSRLLEVTPEENVEAFMTARTHTIYGAVWSLLYTRGLVASADIDESDPHYPLMREIAERKNELHEVITREHGVEVPGASRFVRDLAAQGLTNHLAIASAAVRRDVDIFVERYDLTNYFNDPRIVTLESITKPKPDPECFDTAFRSLQLPESARRSVAAFEDNPRGILSAKRAGLFVCAITTRYPKDHPDLLASEPDMIADSYAEFRDLLKMPA